MLWSLSIGNCTEKEDFERDLEEFKERKSYDIEKIIDCIQKAEGPVKLEYRMDKKGIGINHQLRDEWYNLDDYIRSTNVSLKDFIYSEKIKVDFYQD